MKEIKIGNKEYVVLPQREFDALLDDVGATSYIDTTPHQQLSNNDLSFLECRFIEYLRENVKREEKLIVRLVPMNGKDVSVFRFHLRDIGGK